MCGISGCLDSNNSAMEIVINALNKLQNRGYDSAGICTIDNNHFAIKKNISKFGKNAMSDISSDQLANMKCKLAIGHTRWATHGTNIIENAHPHNDDEMRFSMVHNGIIENYKDLKKELLENGYKFYGQTDTEIVVKYLHFIANNSENKEILHNLSKHIEGSWAILFLDRLQPDKIFFMKNGSPLIIGSNKDKSKVMFVSELLGFDTDIDNYFVIADNEYGYVNITNYVCEINTTKSYTPKLMTNLLIEKSPLPYQHWTLKEINDQPSALMSLMSERIKSFGDTDQKEFQLFFPELEDIKNELFNVDHLIFLACGTSYHAAQIGANFFKEFRINITMEIIDGADFEETDLPPNKNIILILLSQSGETKDLYRALLIGKKNNIRSIGIINIEKSLIAREVDCCLYLRAGREHAVASTKSFTNQVIMLLLLAIWMSPNIMSELKLKYIHALNRLPGDFYKIIKKSINEIPKLLDFFKNQNNCFILGRKTCEWIAKEGSLKIKEISYIHSEGFSAFSLKHGTFALLTYGMPVILLANNDIFYHKIENIMAEVKSRGADIIYITNKKIESDNNINHLFYFNTDSILFPLISIVPLQILAYYLALERGNHPDYPRNLAKVVTVE